MPDLWSRCSCLPPPCLLPWTVDLLPRSRVREGSRRAWASFLRERTALQMPGTSPFAAVDARGMAKGRRKTRRSRHQDRAGAAITSTGGSRGREPWGGKGERAQVKTHPPAQGAQACSPPRHCPASGPLHLLVPLPHACSLPSFRNSGTHTLSLLKEFSE